MIFSITFSVTLDAKAQDMVYDGYYNYSFTTPYVYAEQLGSSVTTSFENSVDYNLGFNLDPNKYYKILILISGLNTTVTNSSSTAFTETFITYAGQRYYMGKNFICLIVPGNSYSIVGFGSKITVHLPSSGQNYVSTRASFSCAPNLVVYELSDSEVEAYAGSSQVVGAIEQGNILQVESNKVQEEIKDLQTEQNETSKGILSSITDFFGSFFQNLIDSVISVFVPDSETMKGLFDELNLFFSDTFGFLYYPFEFLITAFDVFLNSDSSTGISLPSFSIMGHEVWSTQTYDLGSDELAGNIFTYVRIGTGALLSLAFVNYLRNFFDKRFGGGGS